MKKIIISCLLMLCVMFTFVGCGTSGKEYWKDLSEVAGECFENEKFNLVINTTYNDNLNTIMGKEYGEEYYELKTVFGQMFTSAVSYAYNHYNDFQLKPHNDNNKFKNQINKTSKAIKAFSNQLEKFSIKKEEYMAHITFTDESRATSDLERARLVMFKRSYIELIESAYDLSVKIFDARRIGYHDFSNYEDENLVLNDVSFDCALAVNSSNLKIVGSSIMVAKAYNAKSLASEYYDYWTASNNFYSSVLIPFEDGTLSARSDAKERLANWNRTYEIFNNDLEVFKSVLSNINIELLQKCDYDFDKYAEKTNDQEAKNEAIYFCNFYKKLNNLKDYTLALFN